MFDIFRNTNLVGYIKKLLAFWSSLRGGRLGEPLVLTYSEGSYALTKFSKGTAMNKWMIVLVLVMFAILANRCDSLVGGDAPIVFVVTATPGFGGTSPEATQQVLDQPTAVATSDPWAEVGNCGGDVYAVGWGDHDGRLIAATGQTVEAGAGVVYLRKNGLGQNIGAGILVGGGASLPNTGETVHAWKFKSETCARLNQPYINGK